MESHTNPTSKIFMYKRAKAERLMTVIIGIPFYNSSGINSGFEGTWFPHRGIKSYNKWIMKPSCINVPNELKEFYNTNGINHVLPLIRFGTLSAMCISASLGRGFWDSEKGIILKKYLVKHHSDQFLNPEIVDEIKKESLRTDLPKITNLYAANKRIAELGSIIILNSDLSRLPEEDEAQFFLRPNLTPKAKEALKLLLTHNCLLNESDYEFILEFSKKENLMDFALDTYFFEDEQQFLALCKLGLPISDISEKDLSAINQLHDVLADFPKAEEYCLLDFHETRDALRKLKSTNAMNNDNIALVKYLFDHSLLTPFINMLSDDSARQILLLQHKQKSINYDNLLLISALQEAGLLDLTLQLFRDNTADPPSYEDLSPEIKEDIETLLATLRTNKRTSSGTTFFEEEAEIVAKDSLKFSQFFPEKQAKEVNQVIVTKKVKTFLQPKT